MLLYETTTFLCLYLRIIMGAWSAYSFSNDSVYDFLQLDVIPFRIIGGVDELDSQETQACW